MLTISTFVYYRQYKHYLKFCIEVERTKYVQQKITSGTLNFKINIVLTASLYWFFFSLSQKLDEYAQRIISCSTTTTTRRIRKNFNTAVRMYDGCSTCTPYSYETIISITATRGREVGTFNSTP